MYNDTNVETRIMTCLDLARSIGMSDCSVRKYLVSRHVPFRRVMRGRHFVMEFILDRQEQEWFRDLGDRTRQKLQAKKHKCGEPMNGEQDVKKLTSWIGRRIRCIDLRCRCRTGVLARVFSPVAVVASSDGSEIVNLIYKMGLELCDEDER